jgi:hypothetical protein
MEGELLYINTMIIVARICSHHHLLSPSVVMSIDHRWGLRSK